MERFDRGGGFVEGPLDGEHPLARVGRIGVGARLGVRQGRHGKRHYAHKSQSPLVLYAYIVPRRRRLQGCPQADVTYLPVAIFSSPRAAQVRPNSYLPTPSPG